MSRTALLAAVIALVAALARNRQPCFCNGKALCACPSFPLLAHGNGMRASGARDMPWFERLRRLHVSVPGPLSTVDRPAIVQGLHPSEGAFLSRGLPLNPLPTWRSCSAVHTHRRCVGVTPWCCSRSVNSDCGWW
jgi:hypothetical protein